MKIFTSEQIREIDAYTIKNEPIGSVDLMERAALALSYWFRKMFKNKTELVFLAGPGNNGGDAWALARILFHYGYENIRFYLLGDYKNISADSEANRIRLLEETNISLKNILEEEDFPFLSQDDWVIDALFGSGLSRQLEGLAKTLVDYTNECSTAGIVSVDIPSGLFSENNPKDSANSIIKANYTLSFQFPKLSFFFANNETYVGNWEVLPIGLDEEIIKTIETPFQVSTKEEIAKFVKPRNKFTHKGSYGHALVVAGSYGMMGAAVLAVQAAVKSGAGLVTAHVPRLGYQIIQTSVPEALVSLDESDLIYTEVNQLNKYSAIAIGPGLNTKSNTVKGIKELIEKVKVPLVIDADGINILASNKEWLKLLPEDTILTPHPGEFDRLTKKHDSHADRVATQIELSKKYNIIVILKGANTSISFADGTIWFNTTGNAGMAKGGSGDVLTGIICSLLAQSYSPQQVCLLGVYIHGLAGDLALNRKGYHALTPSDIINNLGKAFKTIE